MFLLFNLGRKRSDPENAEPEGEGEGEEEYEEDEEAILSLVDLGTPVKRGAFPNVVRNRSHLFI